MASRADVLGFIASSEPLEKTLARHPDWSRERLRALLREAAVLFEAEDRGASSESSEPASAVPVSPGRPAAPERPRPTPSRSPKSAAPPARESAPPAREPETDLDEPAPPTESPALEAEAPARRLRLYSDGAARGNPGLAGAGAVLMKADGTIVAKLGKFLGRQTNNFAEYHGLLLGLGAAKRLGANEIEVYADSELLIRQLQGRYKVKSPTLRPLYEKAVAELARFRKVRLQHVPREQNKDADEMSNRAIDERL